MAVVEHFECDLMFADYTECLGGRTGQHCLGLLGQGMVVGRGCEGEGRLGWTGVVGCCMTIVEVVVVLYFLATVACENPVPPLWDSAEQNSPPLGLHRDYQA